MKIGIFTFHCAHNYGAVIQCYGLQQYLESIGHQAYVIDYRPQYFDFYKLPKRSSLKNDGIKRFLKANIRYLLIGKSRKKRWGAFESFIATKLNLIPYIISNDYHDFDAIILGSDQIWNPGITGGDYDEVFFGKRAKCKVISYAASSRSNSLSEEQKDFFRSHLDAIDSISVRESSLKNLIQPLTNKIVTTVIDPSFLPDVSEYERICTPIKRNRPYVLVYEVTRNADTYRIANEIAKSLNGDVIELVSGVSTKFRGKRFSQESGPEDFLSYIKSATCVVTTSFHGMALSLKFQKDFYSIRQGTNADLRAESLLTKLGLQSRFVNLTDSVEFTSINYEDVLPKLDKEICLSQNFLVKALQNE